MAHDQYRTPIDALDACAEACNHCAVSCLFEANRQSLARCIQLDMDCAEICRLTAGSLARRSELVNEACSFCATACDACADECQRHEMEHCQRCAEACRRCARELRRISTRHNVEAAARGARPGTH